MATAEGIRSFWLAATGALVLMAGACSAGDGREEPRYEALRTREAMIRIDTLTGEVWVVPLDGDGGWVEVGSAPDPAGLPQESRRYNVQMLAATAKSGGPKLLRADRLGGRAWLAPPTGGAVWTPITDADLPEQRGSAPAPAEPVVQ